MALSLFAWAWMGYLVCGSSDGLDSESDVWELKFGFCEMKDVGFHVRVHGPRSLGADGAFDARYEEPGADCAAPELLIDRARIG